MNQHSEKEPDIPEATHERRGSPWTVVLTAVLALAVLSILPWGRITNNKIKDFNLLEDIFPTENRKAVTDELIDPMLQAAIEEEALKRPEPQPASAGIAVTDSTLDVTLRKPSRVNGEMVIEDYTPASRRSALAVLKGKLANASNAPVRIGVIGDSYIEGDILTQNIRSLLQEHYGGSGVGYMPLHTEIPGFRRSVRQQDSGWETVDMRHSKADSLHTLPGEYFIASTGASSTYKGTSNLPHQADWDESFFAFISPNSGTVTLSGKDGSFSVMDVYPSGELQFARLSGSTSQVKVSTDVKGLVGIGMWLSSSHGVQVDCMPLRGNGGHSHRKLDNKLSHSLNRQLQYDLIILEYGINALTSKQTDYTAYSDIMVKVVKELRINFPNAEILIMGIGDRGQKSGSEVKSIHTAPAMTER